MIKKALPGLILLQSLVWACGENKPDSRYKPDPEPIDLGIWSMGSPLPQWYLKDGQYESGCLMEPSLFDKPPFDKPPFNSPTYKKTRLIFQETRPAREITYFKDAGCAEADHIEGEEATVGMAYRAAPDETGANYIVYQAYEQVQVSKAQVYLNAEDASLLNEFEICGRTWIPDSMNDVMKLDQAICKADEEKLKADQWRVSILLMRLKPFQMDAGFTLVVRERPDGLGVKAGSGLLVKHPELLFTLVR